MYDARCCFNCYNSEKSFMVILCMFIKFLWKVMSLCYLLLILVIHLLKLCISILVVSKSLNIKWHWYTMMQTIIPARFEFPKEMLMNENSEWSVTFTASIVLIVCRSSKSLQCISSQVHWSLKWTACCTVCKIQKKMLQLQRK